MVNFRFLLICALIGVLAFIDIAKPIDMALDGISNKMLAKPVSGDIVQVTYDGRETTAGEAAETILARGAEGVLETSLSDLDDDPYVFITSATYRTKTLFEPTAVMFEVEWWRGVEEVTGLGNPSNAIALLAGGEGAIPQKSIRMDYSYDASSITTYSFDAIAAGFEDISGKKVVLFDEYRLGPEFNIPGGRPVRAPAILALGAQSLQNKPLETIPAPIFLVLITVLYFLILTRCKVQVTLVAFAAIIGIAIAFLGLRSAGYYSQLSIVMVSVVLVSIYVTNQRKREKSFDSSFRHHSALTDRLSHIDSDIVAACIKSYRSFRHGTDPKDMAKFVREVERRLSVAAAGSEIFELEPGVFAWSMRVGDEENMQNHLDAARLIIKEPISLGGRQLSLSVAFGVETHRDRLLTDRFDSALLAARDAQRDGQAFKRSNIAEVEAHKEDMLLLGELEDAIEDDQIYPVFQPKVCLDSLKVVGFEALARWKHPQRGMLSPITFIPLAENNGKASLLTRHMLITSLKIWSDMEMTVPLSVNISPTALMADDFIRDVQDALAGAKLPESMLVLEIVETEALSNNVNTEERLQNLCDLGIELSIDDFGTGYSSLDNVRRLPAKELKLDKKFIDDIGKSETSARLVSTTYKMGSELGLSVVAEGIETLEQLAKLQSIGIHVGQGYYFAKPMLATEIKEYLSSVYRRSQSA